MLLPLSVPCRAFAVFIALQTVCIVAATRETSFITLQRNFKDGYHHGKDARRLQGSTDTSLLQITFGNQPSISYTHTNALFGVPSYGGALAGKLFYSNETGCSAIQDPRVASSVVLVDRSACFPSAVVLRFQQAGAAAVIVADNEAMCGDSTGLCPLDGANCWGCPNFEVSTSCRCSLPFMGDDGDGSLVRIPSMMVSYASGLDMKNRLEGVERATAHMKWDMPNSAGQAELQIWGHPDDAVMFQVRDSLMPFIPYFGNALKFTPRFFIWYGPDQGCGTAGTCGNQCVNHELYCSMDPDGYIYEGASGADVVLESVRQMCLWKWLQPTMEKSYGMTWWKYAQEVVRNCDASYSRECSEQQMLHHGVNITFIRDCVSQANSTYNESLGIYYNSLLQGEVQLQHEMGVKWLPTVIVNDIMLGGSAAPEVVFGAVCSTFPSEKTPDVCNCISAATTSALDHCMQTAGASTGDTSSGLPPWSIALISLVVLASLAVGIAATVLYFRTQANVRRLEERYEVLEEQPTPAAAANQSTATRVAQLENVAKPPAAIAGEV